MGAFFGMCWSIWRKGVAIEVRGCVEAATAEMEGRLLPARALLSCTNNEEREGLLLLLRKRIWALGTLFFLQCEAIGTMRTTGVRAGEYACVVCVLSENRRVVRRILLQTYVHSWTAGGSGLGATTVA